MICGFSIDALDFIFDDRLNADEIMVLLIDYIRRRILIRQRRPNERRHKTAIDEIIAVNRPNVIKTLTGLDLNIFEHIRDLVEPHLNIIRHTSTGTAEKQLLAIFMFMKNTCSKLKLRLFYM